MGGGSGDAGGGVLPGVESTLAAGSAPQAQPQRECVHAAVPAGTRPALTAHTHTLDSFCFRVKWYARSHQ